MMIFTVVQDGAPAAEVSATAEHKITIHDRLPRDPLPIPPAGFIRIDEREAEIFGLAS